MIKNIIFDLDNTLVRCSEYYTESKHKFAELMCNDTGVSIKLAEDIVSSIDLHNVQLGGFGKDRLPASYAAASVAIDVLMGLEPNMVRANKARKIANAVFRAEYKPFYGVISTLTKLKESGYNMFICTKGDPKVQMNKIKKNNLHKIVPLAHVYIDYVKNTTHFVDIIRSHKLVRSETLMVGDSMKDDVVPANKLDIKCVYIRGGTGDSDWLYEDENGTPSYTLDSVRELPDLIDNINKPPNISDKDHYVGPSDILPFDTSYEKKMKEFPVKWPWVP